MFATSRNETELKHAWVAWREASGNKYRQQYLDFIEINQEGAKSLGFEDLQEQWPQGLGHVLDIQLLAPIEKVAEYFISPQTCIRLQVLVISYFDLLSFDKFFWRRKIQLTNF